jgi:TatD DNase family protein
VIDAHCHIDLYQDPRSIIDRVDREGIYVLAVTTTPRAWEGTRNLAQGHARINVALGLHPELVHQRHQEVDLLCTLLPVARYVGEIGLDGSPKCRGSLVLQQQVLRRILSRCGELGGRIMSLHSRAAASEVLDELEATRQAGTPILHWFSGTLRELDRAIRLDCWFSVGPAMLQSAKGRRLVEAMPPNRILTESDGPFARNDTGPLMPWDVGRAEFCLATVWGRDTEEARCTIRDNFRALLCTVS